MRRIAFVIGFIAIMMGALTIFSAPAHAAVAENYQGWMYVDNGQETVPAWRHNGDGWISSRITSSAEWMWAHPMLAYRGYHYAYSPALQAWYVAENTHMHAYVEPEPEPEPEAADPIPVGADVGNGMHVRTVFQTRGGRQTRQLLIDYLDRAIAAGANRDIGVYVSNYNVWGAGDVVSGILDRLDSPRLNVRVATDSRYADNDGARRLRGIAMERGAGNFVQCHQGCFGTGGHAINHNKFMVLNDIQPGAGQVPAIVQSSANWTYQQLTNRYQANIVVSGAGAENLRVAYRNYWRKLENHATNSWTAADTEPYTSPGGAVKLYLFPRPAGTSDPMVSAINNINCVDGYRTVRIAQSLFYQRPGLVTAVRNMDRDCNVNLLVGSENTYRDATVKALDGLPHVQVRCIDHLHSKYMTVKARNNNSGAIVHKVYSGSHNWTGSSLRTADEAMLRIKNRQTHDQFAADFRSMWQGGQASFANCT